MADVVERFGQSLFRPIMEYKPFVFFLEKDLICEK